MEMELLLPPGRPLKINVNLDLTKKEKSHASCAFGTALISFPALIALAIC